MQDSSPLIQQGWLRALIFLIVYVLLQIAVAGIVIIVSGSIDQTTTDGLIAMSLAEMVISVPAVFLFRKFVDGKTFESLGFKWKGSERHAATGFFSGLFILSAGSFVLLLAGNLGFIGIDFAATDIVLLILIMLMVAITEELVIRGYMLNNLLESTNKWVALAITAAVFSLFHLGNPDVTLLSMLGIFIGGILLGINYIYTKNLWFSIIFHFTWNFFQGPVFGYKVSGIETSAILVQTMKGSEILSGGPFGFEASVVAFVLMALVFIFLTFRYSRQYVR